MHYFSQLYEKSAIKRKIERKKIIYTLVDLEKVPIFVKENRTENEKMKATAYIYAAAASIGYESYEAGHIYAKSASRS